MTARDANRLCQCEKLSQTQLRISSHGIPQPPITTVGVAGVGGREGWVGGGGGNTNLGGYGGEGRAGGRGIMIGGGSSRVFE